MCSITALSDYAIGHLVEYGLPDDPKVKLAVTGFLG